MTSRNTFKGLLVSAFLLFGIVWSAAQDTMPTDGYYWKKNDDGSSYWFINYGESIADKCKSYYKQNDLIVFYPVEKKLFVLEDFTTKQANVYHTATYLLIDTSEGFWYKTDSNGLYVYNRDGERVSDVEINEYAANNIDSYFKGTNQPERVVLKNYKTVEPYKLFGSYSYKKYADDKNIMTYECLVGNCDDGFSRVRWENGIISEGFYKGGKPYGPGLLKYTDGGYKYTDFRDSWEVVQGMIYNQYSDGSIKVTDDLNLGGFRYYKSSSSLYAIDIFSDGDKYLEVINSTACMAGDCNNGVGMFLYDNGAKYVGEFQNGYRHGFGQITFANGDHFVGEFKNGQKDGLGYYIWSDDLYYFGEYRNDTYHGNGAMFYQNGNIEAGTWENGKFIKSLVYNN